MKKLLVSFVAVLFAAPLAVSAQTTRPADRPASDTKAPTWKNTAALHETKDIIGTRIKSSDGKDLGEVDQLLIDTQTGKVTSAVIGVGGLAGVGEKKVVVPWSALKFSPTADGKKNAIVMDQSKLDSAPRYERSANMERSPSASPSSDRAPYNPNKK
jgi:sporulation protein YlmC with PRC-barrel domain